MNEREIALEREWEKDGEKGEKKRQGWERQKERGRKRGVGGEYSTYKLWSTGLVLVAHLKDKLQMSSMLIHCSQGCNYEGFTHTMRKCYVHSWRKGLWRWRFHRPLESATCNLRWQDRNDGSFTNYVTVLNVNRVPMTVANVRGIPKYCWILCNCQISETADATYLSDRSNCTDGATSSCWGSGAATEGVTINQTSMSTSQIHQCAPGHTSMWTTSWMSTLVSIHRHKKRAIFILALINHTSNMCYLKKNVNS